MRIQNSKMQFSLEDHLRELETTRFKLKNLAEEKDKTVESLSSQEQRKLQEFREQALSR